MIFTIYGCFPWQDDHDQLEVRVLLSQLSEHRLHSVHALQPAHKARVPAYGHPGIVAYLPQLHHKVAQLVLWAVLDLTEDHNGPCVHLHALVELLPSHVPHTWLMGGWGRGVVRGEGKAFMYVQMVGIK